MDAVCKKRVLVVEARPLTRYALASLTKRHPRMELCAETGDVRTARQCCADQMPDITVIGSPGPGGNAITLLKEFARLHPPVLCVVLSEREDASAVTRAFKAGARAYISRLEEGAELIEAFEHLLRGEFFASRRVSHLLLASLGSGRRSKARAYEPDKLSDRELEIFCLVGKGRGVTAIAKELGVGAKTVETHQRRIQHKLGMRCAAELHRKAQAWVAQAPSG